MKNAVIFDMDGLLLDSEDFWQQAEYEVFSSLGVPLTLADTKATVGWRCDYVVNYWFQRAPWTGPSCGEVADQIIEAVIASIRRQGKLMAGAEAALALCQQQRLPVGIATSSNHRMLLAVLRHFELDGYVDACCSAEFLPYAKPHPQVYLNAAAALGVEPQYCTALEDSLTGLIAAKAARMRCIAVPCPTQRADSRFLLADTVLDSLLQLTSTHLR